MSSSAQGIPKFIKLMQGEWPVFVNVNQIQTFWINGSGTSIQVAGDHFTVKESIQKVMELING